MFARALLAAGANPWVTHNGKTALQVVTAAQPRLSASVQRRREVISNALHAALEESSLKQQQDKICQRSYGG